MKEIFEKSDEIEKKLGYKFRSKNLLGLAFVHRSYWNEHRETLKEHNERLEFLGDSVLSLVSAEFLYKNYPDLPEGLLSDNRARLVEAPACVGYAQILGIGEYILLGKGERMNFGKGRDSILADLFEAVVGAIFLDGGFESAKHFFISTFQNEIKKGIEQPTRNWKAELQDLSQKQFQSTPRYEVIEETGPSHDRKFHVAVFVNEQCCGQAWGGSKKEAQQQAASIALTQLRSKA